MIQRVEVSIVFKRFNDALVFHQVYVITQLNQ